jgi:hypothetical protein
MPVDIPREGDEGTVLCANCDHWKRAHSAFSGCVRGYGTMRNWKNCECTEYVSKEEDITSPTKKECTNCEGTGGIGIGRCIHCPTCKGMGWIKLLGIAGL